MEIKQVFVGGWFQRTRLHLSEIYDFLVDAESPLDLDPKKLQRLRDDLAITNVHLTVDVLEFIELTTEDLIVKILRRWVSGFAYKSFT